MVKTNANYPKMNNTTNYNTSKGTSTPVNRNVNNNGNYSGNNYSNNNGYTQKTDTPIYLHTIYGYFPDTMAGLNSCHRQKSPKYLEFL